MDLNKSLKAISVDSAGMRSIATATNATNRAFERATISAGTYEARLAAIHRLGAAPAIGRGNARLPPAGGGFGGGGHGGGGGFHGGNVHMGPGGIGMGTVGMAAGDAFIPLAATAAMAYAGKSLFESAKELDTERQRFKLFGLSDAQNNEAFGFASRMQVYGTTQTENMRNFREAQGVFREAGLDGSAALDGAKLAAPILSKLNALDGALDDESASRSAASNLSMLRFVESAGGLKSQSEFNRLANIGYKLKVGSGDTVDWQQLQQFEKTGGSAAINLTGEGLARIEPSISTLGGGRVGTSLATGFGRLEGIVKNLPVPVIDELLKNHIWDRSKVELNSKGGVSKFLDMNGPMSAANSKLLTENPEGFYEQVIRPVYAKMHLDAAGVIRQNALIYGRTGGALANEWEKQLATIGRAVSAFNKTLSIDAAGLQLPKSLTGQEQEFEAAWTDFKTSFGTTILPFFTGILKGGASLLRQSQDGHSPLAYSTGWAFLGEAWKMISGGVSNNTSNDSKFVAGRYGSRDVHVTVSADAQKLGLAVTQQQAKSANAPQTGISSFDSLAGAIPAGGLGY